MTVRELKEMLEDYNDDMRIVIQPLNSRYAESIYGIVEDKRIAAFYGSDYKALVLECYEQVGSVCDVDELCIDEDEE